MIDTPGWLYSPVGSPGGPRVSVLDVSYAFAWVAGNPVIGSELLLLWSDMQSWLEDGGPRV